MVLLPRFFDRRYQLVIVKLASCLLWHRYEVRHFRRRPQPLVCQIAGANLIGGEQRITGPSTLSSEAYIMNTGWRRRRCTVAN